MCYIDNKKNLVPYMMLKIKLQCADICGCVIKESEERRKAKGEIVLNSRASLLALLLILAYNIYIPQRLPMLP